MAEGEGKFDKVKGKVNEAWDATKDKSKDAVDWTKDRAKVVDDKVHNNPWPVIGGAFVTGVLLGFILGKKSD